MQIRSNWNVSEMKGERRERPEAARERVMKRAAETSQIISCVAHQPTWRLRGSERVSSIIGLILEGRGGENKKGERGPIIRLPGVAPLRSLPEPQFHNNKGNKRSQLCTANSRNNTLFLISHCACSYHLHFTYYSFSNVLVTLSPVIKAFRFHTSSPIWQMRTIAVWIVVGGENPAPFFFQSTVSQCSVSRSDVCSRTRVHTKTHTLKIHQTHLSELESVPRPIQIQSWFTAPYSYTVVAYRTLRPGVRFRSKTTRRGADRRANICFYGKNSSSTKRLRKVTLAAAPGAARLHIDSGPLVRRGWT